MWLNIGILKNKGVVRIFVIFQDRPMFNHIVQKDSEELSIDVAEHKSILKNNQNTNYPRFVVYTQNR